MFALIKIDQNYIPSVIGTFENENQAINKLDSITKQLKQYYYRNIISLTHIEVKRTCYVYDELKSVYYIFKV
jgi:hypothetical protein